MVLNAAILRDGLVAREGLLPLRVVERRQCTGDRLPLHDRQSGFGEPRRTADQHHDRDQGGNRDQPPFDGSGRRGLEGGMSGHWTRRKAMLD
jgi:hypothetical protein